MKRRMTFVLAPAALALLIGCQAKPIPAPVDTQGGANYVQINLHHDLDGYVVADNALVMAGPTQPMHVQVPIRNVTHDDVWVQYHYSFYDSIGNEMLPDLGWQTLELPVSAQRMAVGSALDTTAAKWRLEIRKQR